jgi:hypothetical protein
MSSQPFRLTQGGLRRRNTLRSDRGGFFCIKLFANRQDAEAAVAERARANRRAAIRSKAGF